MNRQPYGTEAWSFSHIVHLGEGGDGEIQSLGGGGGYTLPPPIKPCLYINSQTLVLGNGAKQPECTSKYIVIITIMYMHFNTCYT